MKRAQFIMHYVICLYLILLFRHSKCQSMDHLKKLFHDIFETRVYDKRIRPVIDQSHPVYVDVSFFVIGLNSVDEENGIISTTFDTSLDWIDESATWKPELFGNITKLHVPQDHIWKPDFVVRNGMSISNDAQKKIGYTSIDYTGKTKWWPYQFHETSCEINISYFPFDKQICNVTFIIWSHSMNEIIIKGKYVGKHQFSKNALWSVDNLELFEDSEHLDGSDYSTITLTLYLSRKANFYMWNLIFPVVALSILQVVVFLVPAKSGEKLSFAFTLFLTYNMFLILMSSMFPENSENISILCIYIDIQLTLGTIIVVVVSIQVQICYQDQDIPFSPCQRILMRFNALNRVTFFSLLSIQLIIALVVVMIIYFK